MMCYLPSHDQSAEDSLQSHSAGHGKQEVFADAPWSQGRQKNCRGDNGRNDVLRPSTGKESHDLSTASKLGHLDHKLPLKALLSIVLRLLCQSMRTRCGLLLRDNHRHCVVQGVLAG